MALKDLASDLANFKYGISSPDKVDNQIEKGVDFFDDKTAGAKGFTPNTDLLTKYNQFMKDVRQNNTLPNQYDGESNILAPNSGLRTNTKTRSAYGTFGEYSEAEGVGLSNPSHVLSSDNLLGVRVQPQFTSEFMTTPLADFVSMFNPPANDSLTLTVPKEDGVGNYIFNDSQQIPNAKNSTFMVTPIQNFIGQYNMDTPVGAGSETINVLQVPHTVNNSFALQNADYKSQKNEGPFTFQSQFSVDTLKRTYNDSDYIEDLFEFKLGTFKNVPAGVNNKGKMITKSFREISDPDNFFGFRQPFILRETGNQWGIDKVETDNPIGAFLGGIVNIGDNILGQFFRGAPTFTGLLSRSITDKFRIGKFLLTPQGIGFLGKQFALQALNPTLETKVYNPLSALSITGANTLFDAIESGAKGNSPLELGKAIGQAVVSAFVPIGHPERHLFGGRYEDILKSTTQKGRLAFQAAAFSIEDIDLGIPPVDTGLGFLDNYLNKKVEEAEDMINNVGIASVFTLSNPNRYGGLISSAPLTIDKGVPSFIGGADLAIKDVSVATSKLGGTFNPESARSQDEIPIKTHLTKGYSELKISNSYLQQFSETPTESTTDNLSVEGAVSMLTKLIPQKENEKKDLTLDMKDDYDRNLGLGSQGTPGVNQTNNPVLGKVKGDASTLNVDKVNIIPYGSNPDNSNSFPAAERDVESDFIKFRFKDVVNNKWLIFRAILEGIADNISPEYGEERYIGRPDKIYTYQGVDRNISFTFSIYPKTKQELPILMEKLNYLVGLCYPSYTEEDRMITPFVELTMGDMFVNTPGILNSLTVTVEEQSTWEIQKGLQLPHFIKAACDFKYIGKYVPSTKGKHYDLDYLVADGLSDNRNSSGDLGFNNYPKRTKKYIDALYTKLGQKIGKL